jgi:peptide/nickel transport system substrate-binding protein
MRTRSVGWRLAAAVGLVAALVAVVGCDADDEGTLPSSDSPSDINPHDPAELRDGGNLRLPISAYPANWNTLSTDGNDIEITQLEQPMMPHAFNIDAAGNLTVDTDYFTDIELTNTDPQQVTYTINPKAVWSDGTPITWEDIASQAHALSGQDPNYLIASNDGFDRVSTVERGVDDRQAIITFAKHFAEWRGQFAGNTLLFPKSVTATPAAFNKGLVNAITATAGPFLVKSTDRGEGRMVLGRNPRWWGATPKLDTITYNVLATQAWVPALQNNELDVVGLATRDDLKTARHTEGVAIRAAPSLQWEHLTFNGAPGSILADPRLRVAIMQGINRQGIVNAVENGMVQSPTPLNNHIFVEGEDGYQDNSIPYDPKAAARQLDTLGWKINGSFREKDGQRLEIHTIMYDDDTLVQIAQIIQQNLQQLGIKLDIDTKPGQNFFTDWVIPGSFDAALFGWAADPFPLGSIPQIWGYDPANVQGNYGHIGSPQLNDLIEQTLSELDPVKARALANEVDKQIWAEGHSLPLFQIPGDLAVRANLANYGSFGLASVDWTKVGYLK